MPPSIDIGPDGHRADVHRDEAGKPRCDARLQNRPGRCRGLPVLGSLRCRLHGGASPRGPAHPSYKHGRESRWREVLGIAVPSADDASMLDIRSGVQIQQEVISRCSERLVEHDSPAFRAEARKRLNALKAAINEDEQVEITRTLRALDQWIARGQREDDVLRRLSDAAYKLSSQVEGAHRARSLAINSMNRQDAMTLLTKLVSVVREEIGVEAATRVLGRVDRELLGGRTSHLLAGGADGESP